MKARDGRNLTVAKNPDSETRVIGRSGSRSDQESIAVPPPL